MLDRASRPGHVVDVDARRADVRQGALQDDREAVADQLGEGGVVHARAGHDEAVGMLGTEQGGVGDDRIVDRERLDHDPEPAGPRRGGQAAERLRQHGVPGDLFGRLAKDEGEDVAPPTGQAPGGGVRVVAQLARGIAHPPTRLLGDLHVRTVVHDE